MGYRTAFLFRWSRRDKLTIIVVAVTTAFLLGTALLLTSAAGYSQTFAESLDSQATVSYQSSAPVSSDTTTGTLVLPVANTTIAGQPATIVGIPPGAPRTIENGSASWQRGRLPTLPAEAAGRGPVQAQTTHTVVGTHATTRLSFTPREPDNNFLDPQWYVTNATVATSLGADGYFIIERRDTATTRWSSVPSTGVPVVGALVYVLAGVTQILRALGLAAGAGGLLILIVVYSVVRMSVRDRLTAIRIIRSTGAPNWHVALLFMIRGGMLVGSGVVLGYAVGLIAIKSMVNAAVYLGLPIALNVAVTPTSATLVGGIALVLLTAGLIAGLAAVYPVVTTPPAQLGRTTSPGYQRSDHRGHPSQTATAAFAPSLLSWESLVPMATTLAVFVLTVLLVFSLAGLAAPLGGEGGQTGTITEAGAPHPLNSRLDSEYVRAVRSSGTPASAEIIYAQVTDGQPYLAHGARYSAFANVTGAQIVAGTQPAGPNEAVIGADLADTLDKNIGDTMTLGGSVSPGVRRVEIVGRYTASGTLDDLLLIPIETADDLATGGTHVHMIRVAGPIAPQEQIAQQAPTGLTVTSVQGPASVTRGEQFNISIVLRNFAQSPRTQSVTVTFQNMTRKANVTVPATGQTTLVVGFTALDSGTATARVSNYTHTISVVSPNAIRIPAELPARAPPGSGLYVPVVTGDGSVATDATVSLGQFTVQTNQQGVVVLPLPSEPGAYTITAQRGNRTAERQIRIEANASRQIAGRLNIAPQTGNVLTNPTVTVELANPWQRPQTRQIVVTGPGLTRQRHVELPPGNATRQRFTLGDDDARVQPGTYEFDLLANGSVIASTQYRVVGDERIASAVASSGTYAAGSSIERSIRGAFGNVQLILVAFVLLAGLSSVGSATATFAQAVHARRQIIGIYRSTGATRTQMLLTVLGDVLRIAVPAAGLAVGLAVSSLAVLDQLGWLVFFGFQLPLTLPLSALFGVFVAGVGLAVIGACTAMIPYLFAPPVSLLHADTTPPVARDSTREQTD